MHSCPVQEAEILQRVLMSYSLVSRLLHNNRPRRNIKEGQREKNETRNRLSWKFAHIPVFSSGSKNKNERHFLWIFEGIKRRTLASYYHIYNLMCNTVLQPGYKTPRATLLTLTFPYIVSLSHKDKMINIKVLKSWSEKVQHHIEILYVTSQLVSF